MQKTKYVFRMLVLPVVLAGSLAIFDPAESKQAPARAPLVCAGWGATALMGITVAALLWSLLP